MQQKISKSKVIENMSKDDINLSKMCHQYINTFQTNIGDCKELSNKFKVMLKRRQKYVNKYRKFV